MLSIQEAKKGGKLMYRVLDSFYDFLENYYVFPRTKWLETESAAHQAAFEHGAPSCDLCEERIATRHYNYGGQILRYDSEWLSGDIFACDKCDVQAHVEERNRRRQERLDREWGNRGKEITEEIGVI